MHQARRPSFCKTLKESDCQRDQRCTWRRDPGVCTLKALKGDDSRDLQEGIRIAVRCLLRLLYPNLDTKTSREVVAKITASEGIRSSMPLAFESLALLSNNVENQRAYFPLFDFIASILSEYKVPPAETYSREACTAASVLGALMLLAKSPAEEPSAYVKGELKNLTAPSVEKAASGRQSKACLRQLAPYYTRASERLLVRAGVNPLYVLVQRASLSVSLKEWSEAIQAAPDLIHPHVVYTGTLSASPSLQCQVLSEEKNFSSLEDVEDHFAALKSETAKHPRSKLVFVSSGVRPSSTGLTLSFAVGGSRYAVEKVDSKVRLVEVSRHEVNNHAALLVFHRAEEGIRMYCFDPNVMEASKFSFYTRSLDAIAAFLSSRLFEGLAVLPSVPAKGFSVNVLLPECVRRDGVCSTGPCVILKLAQWEASKQKLAEGSRGAGDILSLLQTVPDEKGLSAPTILFQKVIKHQNATTHPVMWKKQVAMAEMNTRSPDSLHPERAAAPSPDDVASPEQPLIRAHRRMGGFSSLLGAHRRLGNFQKAA